jgi:riboflavin transporter FmnP
MNYQVLLILNIPFLAEEPGMKIERHGVPVVVSEKIKEQEPAPFPVFI